MNSTVRCRLSLGSFIKLCAIAAIGTLPILALVLLVAIIIGALKTAFTGQITEFPFGGFEWLIAALKVAAVALNVVLTGAFFGLVSYPVYSWLCRRRGGIVLRGTFPDGKS